METIQSTLALLSVLMVVIHGELMSYRIIPIFPGCVGLSTHAAYLMVARDITSMNITTRLWLAAACGALLNFSNLVVTKAED